MKKVVLKTLVAVVLSTSLFSITNVANAYNYFNCHWIGGYYGANGSWMAGHRVCTGGYYSVNRCGWMPGYYASYGWVPGHRACWY